MHPIHRLPVADRIEVYPALRQISRYALYARQNRMSLLGVRRTRRAGTENEFERLRDYADGDAFKAIDWRATSRRLKLTVRDFQMNQSQRVVFALDCGRMMVNHHDGLSMFDAALDASLTLAYVALQHRDEVGILCFSDRILRWMPPRGGQGQLRRMIAATHDVHPELVESRFDEALIHLGHHCRKRTLLVLLTNVIDERNTERIRRHVLPTVGRHLPLVVCLRDASLTDRIDAWERRDTRGGSPAEQAAGTHAAAAAADVLCWRRQVLADWQRAGAPSPPEVIAAAAGLNCPVLLIDTFDKAAGGLFACCPPGMPATWVAAARAARLQVAVAGRLAPTEIQSAWDLRPDVVALRSAVCFNGRDGAVQAGLVRSAVSLSRG